MNPVATDGLLHLTLGGHFAGRIWTLHSRFRYSILSGAAPDCRRTSAR
jgi:hypothetical protein